MNRGTRPGLYVHVPFCLSKCPYCDFYSVTDPSKVPQWREAVERETGHYRDRFSAFDSLYFGGGTPSLLGEREIAALMDLLRRRFSFPEDAEITLEANPDDITPSKARCYRDLGFTRISLGIQSFDDGELRFLKRRHSARRAEEALEEIRHAGFLNTSIDLIFGLPGQSEARWLQSLDRALASGPAHISCYQLTIAPGTPFGRLRDRGRILPLGEERERALFLLTSEYLSAAGFRQYEVSNFSRDRATRCRHNLKYWRREPYLGLGPAAHSFSGTRRWWNRGTLEAYCGDLRAGIAPVEGLEELGDEEDRLEVLLLGLRTCEGIPASLAEGRGGTARAVQALYDAGLIVKKAGRIIPTREGLVVADRMPLLFD